MMPGRVLVLGSNGFVGGWLAKELSARGWDVLGSDVADASAHDDYAWYRPCDVLDASGLARLIREARPDAVVNLAAVSSVGQSWRNPRLTMEVNVMGTLNLLEVARASQAPPRLLLVGSSEQYSPSNEPLRESDPIDASNPYGMSKATQEQVALLYAREWDVPVCLTRSFNHTGPGQAPTFVLPAWCNQVAAIERTGEPGTLHVGNLHVARDFSDVRDVCRAYAMILESDLVGEVLNVGSGKAHTLRDLARQICSFARVPVSIAVDPRLVRDVDVPTICGDATKIRELVGWEPTRELTDTLRQMYEDFALRLA